MSKKRMNFRLDQRLVEDAKYVATERGITLTEMVSFGLHHVINQHVQDMEYDLAVQYGPWQEFFQRRLIEELRGVAARFECKIVKSTDERDE